MFPRRSIRRYIFNCVLAVALAATAALPTGAAPLPQNDGPGIRFTPASPLPPLPAIDTNNAPRIAFQGQMDRMDRLAPVVTDLAARLDRSQFDLDALGASLDYDPARIVDFVRTQIAFEQYPGVLRGELGTLIGRAGNAFDQALLLRRLLDDAGYETRLVRTTLTDAQARRLVAQMAVPRAPAPPIGAPPDIADARTRLRAAAGIPEPDSRAGAGDKYAAAAQLAAQDSALVLDGLNRAGVKLGGDGGLADVVKEASDYLWVQYRLGSFDPWIDAHPAFADPAAAPAGLKAEKYYRDALPGELFHKVRITVTVEQKLGDKLVATPVIWYWERNAADLVGHPIVLRTQPNNFDLAQFTDFDTLLKDAAVFVPFIDGEMGERAFDLQGGTYGASLLASGVLSLAQSGQATSAAALKIAAALGGEAAQIASPDFMTLTAEWIDYAIQAPGGQEITARRYVLDRVGEANRAAGKAEITDKTPLVQAARALLNGYTIMVLPGEYTPAYIAHRAVERVSAELKLRPALKADMTAQDIPSELLSGLTPVDDVVLNAAFADAIAPAGDLLAYRASPTVIVYEQGVAPDKTDTAYERVDVIRNARRVFTVAHGELTPSPADAVRIGVWETLAERAPLRQTGTMSGALEAIRQTTEAGIPLRVLSPPDAGALAALDHSAATKTSVRRDLDAGYVVILPERAASPGADTGWWRVDPVTGETLGMATGGYGDSMVEYAITLFYAFGFFAVGTATCIQATGDGFCCVMSNLMLGALGFGAGMFIGTIAAVGIADAGIAWLVSFLLGDVGLGIGGFVFPAMCQAKVPEPVP